MPSPPVSGNAMGTLPADRVYFPALDGLRAVAFLLVFLQHYAMFPWGGAGVNLFFVLSGFLITGILMDTRMRPQFARTFYARRTLRIFPLYYGVFFLLLVSTPVMHWQWSKGWLVWPLYVGNFLHMGAPASSPAQQMLADGQLQGAITIDLGPFWSLCVEEQFYLFWPWVIFYVRSVRKLTLLCVTTVIAVPMIRNVIAHHPPHWMANGAALYYVTPFQIDSLLLGGLLALLWRGDERAQLISIARFVAVVCTIATVTYYLLVIRPFDAHSSFAAYVYPAWRLTWGLTFMNVYGGSLILCALVPGSIVCRLLDVGFLRWVGRMSYGAYVFHNMFHDSLAKFAVYVCERVPGLEGYGQTVLIVSALTLTLTMAYCSYRFFEKPFLKLKERFEPGSVAVAASPAAVAS